jgi:hypothetical protein
MVQVTLEPLIEQLELKRFVHHDLIQFELDVERIRNICKVLSHHSTAYTLVRPKATGNALDDTLQKIQEFSTKLVQMCLSVPGMIGNILREEFVSRVLGLLYSLQGLITSDNNLNQRVGLVWEKSSLLEQIPKNNCLLMSIRLAGIIEMLEDASGDAQELIDGISFNGEQVLISEIDKQFVVECKSLIKTGILCTKRMSHLLKSVKQPDIFWIQFAENSFKCSQRLSEKADDVICTLELPIDRTNKELITYVRELSQTCAQTLDLIKMGESNTKWTDLCEQQISKLMDSLQLE